MTTTPIAEDPRWFEIGRLLVHEATRVSAGERVMIAMGEADSFPLARGVYEACIRAGAFPQIQFLSETMRESLLRFGTDEQLSWVPEIESYGMEWADVYIALRGGFPLDIHAGIPTERLAANQVAQGVISSLRWKHTRWSLVRVPNQAFADQAGSSLDEVTEMFFKACLLDSDAARREWQGWVDNIHNARSVQILGRGTDLRFSIEGRTWAVAAGGINIPDGELMTAPVTETVDGVIEFENPAVFGGRLIEGVKLRWDHGTLVEATASTNEDFLRTVLATDAGASAIGEFGIGTNPHIDRFFNDILIDEKIAGTVHIALGRAYPECGGTNVSAIHWDIVKDLRTEGSVLIDGRTVLERGVYSF
ncbi:MAG: aminopeptidase [Microbacteriaceae bacterium]|jgi:aminopeptidase|nr:aminopeptidase [Microbacteriaceae bacterium]